MSQNRMFIRNITSTSDWVNRIRCPQNGWRSTIKHKITVVLHNQNTVFVHATSVTGPFGMFVLTMIAWIVNHQVSIALHNHMQVAMKTVRVWGPNGLVTIVVNNEISITLHYSIEDTVSTDKLFSDVKSWPFKKAVSLSTPESNVLCMIILIAWTVAAAAILLFLLLLLLLVWVRAPKLSRALTE